MNLNDRSIYSFYDMSQSFAKKSSAPKMLNPGETYTVEIEMFRSGKFYHAWYGNLNFDKTYLESIVRNWKNKVYPTKLSFDLDHDPTKGAVGWIAEDENALYIVEKEIKNFMGQVEMCQFLIGKVELNSFGYGLVLDNIYKYFSAEIYPKYKGQEKVVITNDDGTSTETTMTVETPVISGGSLTNKPFIQRMAAVSLSENGLRRGHDDDYDFTIQGDEKFFFASAKKKEDMKKDSSLEEESDVEEVEDDEEEVKQSETKKKKVKASECDCGKTDCSICSKKTDMSKNKKEKDDYSDTQGGKMNFSDLLTKIKDMSLAEKIAHLEGQGQQFSTDATYQIILSSLREQKRQDDLASQLVAEKNQFRQQIEDQNKKINELAVQAKQAAEIGWQHQVELFCEKKISEGHFPAVVNKAKEILSGLNPSARNHKFSLLSKPEEEFGLMQSFDMLLAAMPATAKTTEQKEEKSASSQTVETKPESTQTFSEPAKTEKQEKAPEVPANVQAFYDKYSKYYPFILSDKAMWDQITPDGELDLAKALGNK